MSTDNILINDVGPRDGLQNQANMLSVEQRLALIQALLDAKVPAIEVGAFVSPKAVPAMAGTADIIAALPDSQTIYSALIPNMKGYELAQDTAIPLTSLVVAASNTMNEKNIRMSTEQALAVCLEVLQRSERDDTKVQAYVATAWACPFEGQISSKAVMSLCESLLSGGAAHIVIADTIGAAHPMQVQSLMGKLVAEFGSRFLSCHFHDTRAMGLANVYAAIESGIRQFDAAIAGLGGCPFAPGASGNVATEDLVMMVDQMGLSTGIDMAALLRASDLAIKLSGTATGGKAKKWIEQYYDQQ